MTITRATEETEVRAGHWVHGPSSLQYGQHSEPRLVTRIAGKRVHYKRLDGTESFMLRAAVLLVCDSEAEARRIHELSIERDYDVCALVNQAIDAGNHRYEVRFAELLRAK
jgi:hypothetical protein